MASKSEKPILLSLLKLLQKICLYAKFMLMIVGDLFSNAINQEQGNIKC
jgi:hypothetical protein